MPLLDYLRVPYRVAEPMPSGPEPGDDQLPDFASLARAEAGAEHAPPRLYWIDRRDARLDGIELARHDIGGIPVFARALPAVQLAAELPGTWRPSRADEPSGESDPSGGGGAMVWRHPSGSILLPFDPSEAVEALWSEAYLAASRGPRRSYAAALRIYYRLRPVLPRPLQIAVRRGYSRVQGRRAFPRWPIEPAFHDLLRWFYLHVVEIARQPVPWIAPWPAPKQWAIVLTHDVETAAGQERIAQLRDVERQLGYRSSWNFVARRYRIDEELVRDLRDDGFEAGVHGLFHDGRDLESLATLEARLPEMREVARRLGAVGFRAPATQRRWEWMPRLGFEYDSSYPDTDPYEPQPGGCCAWWPVPNGDMVELPITQPQDHTLFSILGHRDERAWVDKARRLRERSGMAVMLTHPDYLRTADEAAPYRRFLEEFEDDPSAWRALPREVAAWWQRRAASTVEVDGEGWRIVGPAAGEAAVSLDPPP